MAKKRAALRRYWGYLLLVVLYLGWFQLGFDPGLLAGISGLIVLYGLFAAPVPCCAITRDGLLCRRNATGLLRGCHLEQHKWQNAKMIMQRQSWARLTGNVFRSLSGNSAALTVIIGMVSAATAIIMPLVTKTPSGG